MNQDMHVLIKYKEVLKKMAGKKMLYEEEDFEEYFEKCLVDCTDKMAEFEEK
jgi:hypothetical protein